MRVEWNAACPDMSLAGKAPARCPLVVMFLIEIGTGEGHSERRHILWESKAATIWRTGCA